MRALVAVDLAQDAERVVDLGAAWAARLGARADLVFAGGHRDAELSALLARIPAENRGIARCVDGRAVDAVPEIASGYDLVIAGTHGGRGLDRSILGSIAERIVRACPKPVLVVRQAPAEGPIPAMCAVDVRDPRVGTAVGLVNPWLEALGATGHLAYIEPIDMPAAPQDLLFGEAWMAQHDATESADFRRLSELNSQVPEATRGTPIFGEGDVDDELLTASDRFALAIVVTHGRSGIARWWLGSVAEPFVRATRCSVLVLHYPA